MSEPEPLPLPAPSAAAAPVLSPRRTGLYSNRVAPPTATSPRSGGGDMPPHSGAGAAAPMRMMEKPPLSPRASASGAQRSGGSRFGRNNSNSDISSIDGSVGDGSGGAAAPATPSAVAAAEREQMLRERRAAADRTSAPPTSTTSTEKSPRADGQISSAGEGEGAVEGGEKAASVRRNTLTMPPPISPRRAAAPPTVSSSPATNNSNKSSSNSSGGGGGGDAADKKSDSTNARPQSFTGTATAAKKDSDDITSSSSNIGGKSNTTQSAAPLAEDPVLRARELLTLRSSRSRSRSPSSTPAAAEAATSAPAVGTMGKPKEENKKEDEASKRTTTTTPPTTTTTAAAAAAGKPTLSPRTAKEKRPDGCADSGAEEKLGGNVSPPAALTPRRGAYTKPSASTATATPARAESPQPPPPPPLRQAAAPASTSAAPRGGSSSSITSGGRGGGSEGMLTQKEVDKLLADANKTHAAELRAKEKDMAAGKKELEKAERELARATTKLQETQGKFDAEKAAHAATRADSAAKLNDAKKELRQAVKDAKDGTGREAKLQRELEKLQGVVDAATAAGFVKRAGATTPRASLSLNASMTGLPPAPVAGADDAQKQIAALEKEREKLLKDLAKATERASKFEEASKTAAAAKKEVDQTLAEERAAAKATTQQLQQTRKEAEKLSAALETAKEKLAAAAAAPARRVSFAGVEPLPSDSPANKQDAEKMRKLQEELAKVMEQAATVTAERRALEAGRKTLQERVATLEQQLQQQQTEEKEQLKSGTEIAELRAALRESERSATRLFEEREAFRRDMRDLETRAASTEEELVQARQQIESLQQQQQQQQQQQEHAKSPAESAGGAGREASCTPVSRWSTDMLPSPPKAAAHTDDDDDDDDGEREKKLRLLAEMLAEQEAAFDSERQRLQERIQELEDAVCELQGLADERAEEATTLTVSLEEAEIGREHVLSTYTAKAATLTAELARLQAERERDVVDAVERTREELLPELEALKADADSLRAELDSKEGEMRQLRRDLQVEKNRNGAAAASAVVGASEGGARPEEDGGSAMVPPSNTSTSATAIAASALATPASTAAQLQLQRLEGRMRILECENVQLRSQNEELQKQQQSQKQQQMEEVAAAAAEANNTQRSPSSTKKDDTAKKTLKNANNSSCSTGNEDDGTVARGQEEEVVANWQQERAARVRLEAELLELKQTVEKQQQQQRMNMNMNMSSTEDLLNYSRAASEASGGAFLRGGYGQQFSLRNSTEVMPTMAMRTSSAVEGAAAMYGVEDGATLHPYRHRPSRARSPQPSRCLDLDHFDVAAAGTTTDDTSAAAAVVTANSELPPTVGGAGGGGGGFCSALSTPRRRGGSVMAGSSLSAAAAAAAAAGVSGVAMSSPTLLPVNRLLSMDDVRGSSVSNPPHNHFFDNSVPVSWGESGSASAVGPLTAHSPHLHLHLQQQQHPHLSAPGTSVTSAMDASVASPLPPRFAVPPAARTAHGLTFNATAGRLLLSHRGRRLQRLQFASSSSAAAAASCGAAIHTRGVNGRAGADAGAGAGVVSTSALGSLSHRLHAGRSRADTFSFTVRLLAVDAERCEGKENRGMMPTTTATGCGGGGVLIGFADRFMPLEGFGVARNSLRYPNCFYLDVHTGRLFCPGMRAENGLKRDGTAGGMGRRGSEDLLVNAPCQGWISAAGKAVAARTTGQLLIQQLPPSASMSLASSIAFTPRRLPLGEEEGEGEERSGGAMSMWAGSSSATGPNTHKTASGVSVEVGDEVTCCLDMREGTISYWWNGVPCGVVVGGLDLRKMSLYPAVEVNEGGIALEIV